jgi:EmrB/QacA subfamily drug resistance transporter
MFNLKDFAMTHHPPAHAPQSGADPGPGSPGRWLALGLLGLAQLMLILDITVVNIALPDLSTDVGLGSALSGWAITAYAIPFAGLMLLGGRSADLFGSRRVFLAGLIVFTLSSLAAGLATDATMLLLARAAQGAGAAFLSPAALSTVMKLFVGEERPRALAVWGAIGGTGAAVGVLLGGLLTAGPGWRWIFFVNVPVGVLVALLVPLLVPAAKGIGGARLDLTGAILATVATASLVYGITLAGSGAEWLLPLGIALVLFAAFVLVERQSVNPLIDLKLLARRPIQAGAFLILVATGLLVGSFFLLSFVLQARLSWTALDTGLGFLPVAVATIIGAHLAGQLIGHLGGRLVAAAGLLLAAAGMGVAVFQIDAPLLLIGSVALVALGLGATFVAATTTAMSHAGAHETGIVSGFVNTFHEFGGAIGVAVLSAVSALSLMAPEQPAGFTAAFAVAAAVALAAALISGLLVPAGRPAPGTARFVH